MLALRRAWAWPASTSAWSCQCQRDVVVEGFKVIRRRVGDSNHLHRGRTVGSHVGDRFRGHRDTDRPCRAPVYLKGRSTGDPRQSIVRVVKPSQLEHEGTLALSLDMTGQCHGYIAIWVGGDGSGEDRDGLRSVLAGGTVLAGALAPRVPPGPLPVGAAFRGGP